MSFFKGKGARFSSLAVAFCLVFATGGGAAADDRGEAEVKIGEKSISVEYGRPSTEGSGYKSMKDGVPDGFIWRMGSNAATTLKSDAKLKFGDVAVEAGEYSLAAQKTEEGWNLLVHPDPKRRGTGSEEDYIASIPLKSDEIEEEVELLTIHLKEKEGQGKFVLKWGNQKLSAPFEVSP